VHFFDATTAYSLTGFRDSEGICTSPC